MGKNKDRCIRILALMSETDQHELLLRMLDRYGAKGLYELSENQTVDFLLEVLERRYSDGRQKEITDR